MIAIFLFHVDLLCRKAAPPGLCSDDNAPSSCWTLRRSTCDGFLLVLLRAADGPAKHHSLASLCRLLGAQCAGTIVLFSLSPCCTVVLVRHCWSGKMYVVIYAKMSVILCYVLLLKLFVQKIVFRTNQPTKKLDVSIVLVLAARS